MVKMMMMSRLVELVAVLNAFATAAAAPSPNSLSSDLRILMDNDLQGADSPSADSGIILLSAALPLSEASEACEALGEELWSPEAYGVDGILPNLEFLKLELDDGGSSNQKKKKGGKKEKFWIAPRGRHARVIDQDGKIRGGFSSRKEFPVLCTQTAPFSYEGEQDTGERWRVRVQGKSSGTGTEGIVYEGFRDRLSFRFLGIRYAEQPERFGYSELYEGEGEEGEVTDATEYAPQCMQYGSGSEDCLFLNIWTSLLPQSSSSNEETKEQEKLKPVMFWIHGGAFTGGTGSDATMDGGNIVSRGDVVLVTINYRLGNLGFLALDDGVTNGNFGFADQLVALDWVRKNIREFGGDPDRITVFGQSAGAGSVRAMMESPEAKGKFKRAIPLSNLGGLNYGTTYSRYYTIAEEMEVVGNQVLELAGCENVECLRGLDAEALSTLGATARYMVVDGRFITNNELQLADGEEADYDLMMGITRDDGGPFISYPDTTDKEAYLAASGFDVPPEALFPIPDGANETYALYNMTSRLATDGIFRCIDQATVKAGLATNKFSDPGVYYYEFDRTYQTTGWPKSSVCEPPKTEEHPYGDPSLEYFKCHSGELYYVFGNLARQRLPARDEFDLPFEQFVLDSFSAFARTGNPNPDERFLSTRGYESTLRQLKEAGTWVPATANYGEDGLTMRVLDWPSYQGPFREVEQCEALGLGLEYYL